MVLDIRCSEYALEMQQRWVLVQVEQTEDDSYYLDDLSYTPGSRQQPNEIEDEKKDCYRYEEGNYRHNTLPFRVPRMSRGSSCILVGRCGMNNSLPPYRFRIIAKFVYRLFLVKSCQYTSC
jgi:hypothetical protein